MATDGHCPMSTLHWEIWLAGQAHLKESSRERYAGILREHIIPVWGKLPLANVSHADVQAWVTQLAARRSAATTKKAHRSSA